MMSATKMRLKAEAIQVLLTDLQWDEMEAIKFMVLGKEIPDRITFVVGSYMDLQSLRMAAFEIAMGAAVRFDSRVRS